MKKACILLLMFTMTLAAQDSIKPKFKKEGNLVKASYFHDNGDLAQLGYFKDKLRHGNWISFSQEGEKLSMGSYQLGKKNGQWFFWKENELIEVIYEKNKIVNVLEWNNSEKKLIAKNN